MTRGPTVHGLAAILLLAALPAVARAAPDLLEARKHHARGEAHLKAEEFREAIVEFEEAFKWSGQPEMLYNIGKVYRRLGMVEGGVVDDLDRSIDCFRRFLALRPRDRDREHIEKWLDEMSLRAARLRSTAVAPRAAQPVRRPVAPTTVATPPAAIAGAGNDAGATGASAGEVSAARRPASTSDRSSHGGRPLGAEIGLGLGIAVGAAAAALGAYALSQDGTPACHLVAPATHCPTVVDSTLTGGLLVGVGGALALGSAVALAIVEVRARRHERSGAAARRLTLSPQLWNGGAALVAATRW